MKVGIVTIIDNNNYGNRLQNYAVQRVLESLGHEAITLDNRAVYNMQRSFFYKKIKFKHIDSGYSENEGRRECFKSFNDHVNFSNSIITPFSKCSEFDYIICGSDQIWNPYFGVSDVMLLKSIPPSKRIAFSASFGVDTIPERMIKYYTRELIKFKCISVREDSGAHLVKRLADREAEVIIDPTMLLTKSQWENVSVCPRTIDKNKPYVLLYFLGGKVKHLDEIQSISKKRNLAVYDLGEKDSPLHASGPSEFIWLIKNASLIMTDSFHATAFSTIFHKEVMVFERDGQTHSMGSRIDTLLNKFSLSHCIVDNAGIVHVKEADYGDVDKLLLLEQKKAMDYLTTSML